MVCRERKQLRLRHFDYGQNGYYFITICTKDRLCVFGKIADQEICLSEIGQIVQFCWLDIPNHFPNVFVDEYIIMPNHIHGIIGIDNNDNAGNADLRSLQKYDRTKMLLPKIIHGFKSSVTRIVNRSIKQTNFQWQKSYYERIIQNQETLIKIQNYIKKNPYQWEIDKNNPNQKLQEG